MTLEDLRRDGRERQGHSGAEYSARAASANYKSLATRAISLTTTLLSLTLLSPGTHAFQVIPTSSPNHSMEQLVLGTVNLPNLPSKDPHQFLDDAYQRGFRRFDLARTYGLGKSEKIFGKWMEQALQSGQVDRDELTVLTKGGMGNDKYGDPNRAMCTRESLRGELMASLESLRTDYADIYMLHRDDPRIQACEFVDWMNELVNDGLIKRWGVSNWSYDRIRSACTYASQSGQEKPTASSPQLSLAVPKGMVWPSTESVSCPSKVDELAWYKKEGIEVMGWEALAKGFMAVPTLWEESSIDRDFLNGPDAELGSNEWRTQRIQRAYCTPENYERRNLAHDLAKASGLSLAQVSLLYSLQKGDHVSVLVGAENTQHLDEMANLRGWRLDDEAFESLTQARFVPKDVLVPSLVDIQSNIFTNVQNSTEIAYV